MKKEVIEKTAVCYWSNDDRCYVVESPLFDSIAGTGDTAAEAMTMFQTMLDDWYPDLMEGKVLGYGKSGRPAKGGVALNCLVRPESKDELGRLSKRLGISHGELVDYLLFHYSVTKDNQANSEAAAPNKKLASEIAKLVCENLAEYRVTPADPKPGRKKVRKRGG
jgi:predicted RNase H-like HicB family nuclease